MKTNLVALLLTTLFAFGSPALAQSPAPRFASESLPEAPAAAPEDSLVEADYGQNIRIEGTEEFVTQVIPVLDSLAQLPNGQQILEALGSTGHDTVIREFDGVYGMAGPLDPSQLMDGFRGPEGNGPGADALVSWNPGYVLEGFNDPIVMGHELIHALDLHRGMWSDDVRGEGANAETLLDELRAIGTDGFEDAELSENILRGEWNGLNPRDLIPSARTGHAADAFADEDPGLSQAEGAIDLIQQHLGGK
jgi:hypothetical protein